MIKTYYSLTKPGIVWSNALAGTAGFFLASRGHPNFLLLLASLAGLCLVVASACAANNYLDHDIDALMERTKNRALPAARVQGWQVLLFAAVLGTAGVALLYAYTNWYALGAALAGFYIYVFLYSPLKRRTMYATHVGAVAGAMPPVVGYAAAAHALGLGALLVFAILFLWQMPHFFAIALYREDEYRAAHIPLLPIVKGVQRAKAHMAAYVAAFAAAAYALFYAGFAGLEYAVVMGIASLLWLVLALQGFLAKDNKRWARKMFFVSLLVLLLWCGLLIFFY